MRLAKTLVIVATAAVFVTSVATAGAATPQKDRQRLRDATCTSQTCTPVGDAVKAQNGPNAKKGQKAQNGAQNGAQAQRRLQDGSCTTVAAVQARDRQRVKDGTCTVAAAQARDQQRLKDGSCTTVAAAQLRTHDKIKDRLHLQDGSCLTA